MSSYIGSYVGSAGFRSLAVFFYAITDFFVYVNREFYPSNSRSALPAMSSDSSVSYVLRDPTVDCIYLLFLWIKKWNFHLKNIPNYIWDRLIQSLWSFISKTKKLVNYNLITKDLLTSISIVFANILKIRWTI
jgi:hypothetical protein